MRTLALHGRWGVALRPALACVLLLVTTAALAHHSYAMFESAATKSVSGTVAKLEWKNPHVFVWVYVPNRTKPGEYDLWAFENGSPAVLKQWGWTSETLKAGDSVTVEYWALRDGRPGGHWEKGTLADGRILLGAGGPGR